MEQESKSGATKDNDPAREDKDLESPVDIVDKTIADNVADSDKVCESGEKESCASNTVVDKDNENSSSNVNRSEILEAEDCVELEKSSKIDEIPEADKSPEIDNILEGEKSIEEDTLCGEKEKVLPTIACIDVDNLSIDEEKLEASSTPEPAISIKASEFVDLHKEISDKTSDETASEKTAEKTVANELAEETTTDEPNDESPNKEIVDKPEEDDSAESCIEETLSDKPNDELSSKKMIDEPADDDTAESPRLEETTRSKYSDLENLSEIMDPQDSETKKSADDSKSDSESTSHEVDSHGKEIIIEKQMVEPENTEFVQITQDKQDDAQTEGQSIDAEDPFGGDNLIPDNVEQTDVDSPSNDEVNFHKLGDQAVNLQDVVNAKETNFKDQTSSEFVTEDSNLDDALEINVDTDSAEILASDESERNIEGSTTRRDARSNIKDTRDDESSEKSTREKRSIESMSVDGTSETIDEDGAKKKNEGAAMETEESQSNVLPGQDDELCIIPDSMKESATSRDVTADIDDPTVNDVEMEKSMEGKDDEGEPEEIAHSKETEVVVNDDEEMREDDNAPLSSQDRRHEEQENTVTEKKYQSSMTTDVIDIDDEMKSSDVDVLVRDDVCKQCNETKSCNIIVKIGVDTYNVCSQTCKIAFTNANSKSMDIPSDAVNSTREKRCASCLLIVETGDERNLSWETMEFCNEECLGKFQTKYGSYCRNCNGAVQAISLGKYCVRFGYDVRQFCCSSCLEEFKKGLKVCSYCQKDISSGTEGFLAPVGDKGQFKDFCTQYCMEKYSRMNSNEPPSVERKACSVCQEVKVVHCEVQIDRSTPVAICSDPCFAAFKFVNKVDPEQCSTCKKFFELAGKKSFVVFHETEAHTFCNKTCLNIFIITNRKIVPCNWCKVKKYNFDMIKKDLKTGQALMMCSLNCLTLYQVSVNAVSAKRISCDFCKEFSQAQYHLTMSDATIRNFCSYNCVMKFQSQYTKSPITIPSGDDPVPTGMPKRTYPPAKGTQLQAIQKSNEITAKKAMPVISSVTSLASLTTNGQVTQTPQPSPINNANVAANTATTQSQTPQVIVNQQVIARPPSPVKIHNKVTQCKPLTHTKGVSVRPHPCPKSTQTDGEARVLIPIPVPIYVPFPVHMWSMPFPVPVPFPLPIPVPIFIPTTRNSAKGIFKDIKRIQDKIPADPFEAELLMMAEMVATEKKANESDSDSSDDNGRDTSEPVDSSNTFGEDMLQMALKMATGELDEPAVDLETALTPSTITATQTTSQGNSTMNTDVQPERNVTASNRGKKRMVPYKPRGAPSKRGRRISSVHDVPMMPPPESQPSSQPRMMEPIEKPDANMALKYTFGVNAWRQWVISKNAELEKQVTPPRKVKLFKTDLLQLTADELNYTLCLFVKEVRKPNGAEYAPDTIYYLCLGIQQYLFENNRIDNIFTDSYYEKFTDCLNDVAKKFSVLYNDAQYIVTRVEEEHLWECKQLGAHSPHVLLSTLMFFNTKHFNLVTVEEHMQLSFSHIMKHWKRNPAAQAAAVAGKGPSTRNVLLRFYPPQSALEANSRKKKVYEQQEKEENPLRCPVKLYEFYLSKCPESVKTRNDVFYLLPERSCVPDSPVWYSTSALAKEHLVKMLYRVKMVKEINVALLTS